MLTKADSLSESRVAHLAEILDSHSNLAICYAMKEEMCSLFDLRDPDEAEIGRKGLPLPRKAESLPSSNSRN